MMNRNGIKTFSRTTGLIRGNISTEKSRWLSSSGSWLVSLKGTPYKDTLNVQELENGLLDVSIIPEGKRRKKGIILDEQKKVRHRMSSKMSSKIGIPLPSIGSLHVQRLIQFIAVKNLTSCIASFERLYHENPKSCLSALSSSQCSQLLALFPPGNIKSKEHWPMVQKIASCIESSGLKLTSNDYAILLEFAFKAHDYQSIEKIWEKVENNLDSSAQTTHLWNTYMMATCNTYPKFWKQWAGLKVSEKMIKMFESDEIPLATNDAIQLLSQMLERKIYPNSRTYEHVVLYLCQKGDLKEVRDVIWAIWNISSNNSLMKRARLNRLKRLRPAYGKPLYPTVSTLISIINGFCLNGRLSEGLIFINRFQQTYKIDLTQDGHYASSNEAICLWSIILRWAYLTQGPIEGAFSDPNTFENVWSVMTAKYKIRPNDLMYRLRGSYYSSRNEFDKLIEGIPEVLNSGNPNKVEIACLNLKRALKGYARHGLIDDSVRLANEWSKVMPEFEVVKQDFMKYMNSSSLVQRLLAEKGDEEDHKEIEKGYEDMEETERKREGRLAV